MELAEIVSSEKVDNKKVEEEVRKMKYYDEVFVMNNGKKGVER
jgi:hypothetical protein